MTDDNRTEGTQAGGFGIGMIWDADGNVKPPLTKDHERLHKKVERARHRWDKTCLKADYDRMAALEERLARAIDKAREEYEQKR